MSKNNQKKRTWWWKPLVITGGLLGTGGVLLALRQIFMLVMALLFGVMLAAGDSYDLLLTTTSPGGEYVLEALRENTSALEPYYVQVNLLNGDEKRNIYDVRGQSEVEIIWLSDTVAQINGVPVDVTSGECFKANAMGYFFVNVFVKAEDVCGLEMTVSMDREPRVTKYRAGVPLTGETDAWGLTADLNVLQELHWDDDLKQKKAGLTVAVETVDGQHITLPYIVEWTAREYGSYSFIVTGSVEAGYTLEMENGKCTVTSLEEANN